MSSPKVQRPDNVNIMFQMEGSGAHMRSSTSRQKLQHEVRLVRFIPHAV